MAKAPAKKTRPATKKTATAKKAAPAKKAATKRAVKKVATRKSVTAKGPGTAKSAKPAAPRKAAPTSAKLRLPSDLKKAIQFAQDKQAIDLTVLDLREASAFTDFFIICTGANTKQVQAIADGIEAGLKADGQPPALVEGYNRGEWVLLDYFTFIVHVFLPGQRSFYALERLWGGAETIEVSAS
jgi:ribosome-associated protein